MEVFLEGLNKNVKVPAEIYLIDNSPTADQENRPNFQSQIPLKILSSPNNIGFGAAINMAANFQSELKLDLLILNPDAKLLDPISTDQLDSWRNLGGIVGLGVYDDPQKTSRQKSARAFPNLLTSIANRNGLLTRVWPNNPFSKKYLGENISITGPSKVDWVSGAAFFCAFETFQKIGGFDPAYFLYVEDVDFCRSAFELGIPVWFDPTVSVFHAGGNSSKFVPIRSDMYHHLGMLRYTWKWSNPLVRLAWPILAIGISIRFLFRLTLRPLGLHGAS